MAITQAVNFTVATEDFLYADAAADAIARTHLQRLGKAVDNHDHSSTRGLPAVRIGPSGSPVTISGTPVNGQVLRASSATAASWTVQGASTSSSQDVTTSETTTSTSYTDLTTSGPAVTLTPGSAVDHLIHIQSGLSNNSGNTTYASVAIAGAAAADVDGHHQTGTPGDKHSSSVLAADAASGATHTMKYRVSGTTGTYINRRIIAVSMAT